MAERKKVLVVGAKCLRFYAAWTHRRHKSQGKCPGSFNWVGLWTSRLLVDGRGARPPRRSRFGWQDGFRRRQTMAECTMGPDCVVLVRASPQNAYEASAGL